MPQPDTPAISKLVLEFCHFPLQAQMVTINRAGMPVGRTLGADLKQDYSVDLLTFPHFWRVKHLRRNPQMLLIWVEGKQPGYIYPRAVFARGSAQILEGDPIVELYGERVAKGDELPHIVRPDMTFKEPRILEPEEVRQRMCVIRFSIDEIRAEGFSAGEGPLERRELLKAVTWRPGSRGATDVSG